MNLFNRNKEEQPGDVKVIRDELLYAIRKQLSYLQGGEGRHVQSIIIYFLSAEENRPLYEAVVYSDEETKFKKEVQRIADDYDLNLPSNWKLEVLYTDVLPGGIIKIEGEQAGIYISTEKKGPPPTGKASLTVLQGEADQAVYSLQGLSGRINIGRDKKIILKDGFQRTNDICFPGNSADHSNKFVSSQHAHIEFDIPSGKYLLYADPGGIPPNNKVKVRRKNEANAVKLQSREVPHLLEDGDMIILGESAMLEFKLETS